MVFLGKFCKHVFVLLAYSMSSDLESIMRLEFLSRQIIEIENVSNFEKLKEFLALEKLKLINLECINIVDSIEGERARLAYEQERLQINRDFSNQIRVENNRTLLRELERTMSDYRNYSSFIRELKGVERQIRSDDVYNDLADYIGRLYGLADDCKFADEVQ